MTEKKAHPLVIYTDGSSRGNPGNGGYGAILISILESGPPASINNTLCAGFSDNRFAKTQPAEPAPIII